MSAEQIMQVQQQIAQWVFEFAPPNWGKCCIYIELMPEPEMRSEQNPLWMANSSTTVWYDKNSVKIDDYRIPGLNQSEMIDLFFKLNEECAKLNERWTTCRMKVTADGTFDFNFGYEPPPRLTGSAEDLLYHPDYENF